MILHPTDLIRLSFLADRKAIGFQEEARIGWPSAAAMALEVGFYSQRQKLLCSADRLWSRHQSGWALGMQRWALF